LHFHGGIGYKYNLVRADISFFFFEITLFCLNGTPFYIKVQPVTLYDSIIDGSPLSQPAPPHVAPTYAIIAAEAIGSSGSTYVSELFVDDPRVSGYAFYEGGVLARAVFINSSAGEQDQHAYRSHI
jgi:hypothetical protein